MIYNTRNRSSDATESQKENKKAVLMLTFSTLFQKSRIIKVHIHGIRCFH